MKIKIHSKHFLFIALILFSYFTAQAMDNPYSIYAMALDKAKNDDDAMRDFLAVSWYALHKKTPEQQRLAERYRQAFHRKFGNWPDSESASASQELDKALVQAQKWMSIFLKHLENASSNEVQTFLTDQSLDGYMTTSDEIIQHAKAKLEEVKSAKNNYISAFKKNSPHLGNLSEQLDRLTEIATGIDQWVTLYKHIGWTQDHRACPRPILRLRQQPALAP